jgi:4-hydroxybenzoate polyprenyltransferase
LTLIYIAGVTALSRGEVHGGKRPVAAFSLTALSLVLGGLASIALHSTAAIVVVVVLAWRVLPPFWKVYREPVPATIRAAVRTGVLSLVLLDAAIGASYSNALYCLIILGIAVLASLLARAFSVT